MLAALATPSGPALRSQTIVTTHDGLVFEGKILSKGVDSLTLLTAGGRRIRIGNLQVRSIAEPETIAPPPAVAARERCTDCPMLGGAILDPAGVNLIVGFRVGVIGVRMTGLYLGGDYYGGELDFVANLEDDGRFIHDIYLGMGLANNTDFSGRTIWGNDSRRYTVIGYDVSYIGIYANVGLSFGRGTQTDKLLNAVVQLGYVKQFR